MAEGKTIESAAAAADMSARSAHNWKTGVAVLEDPPRVSNVSGARVGDGEVEQARLSARDYLRLEAEFAAIGSPKVAPELHPGKWLSRGGSDHIKITGATNASGPSNR